MKKKPNGLLWSILFLSVCACAGIGANRYIGQVLAAGEVRAIVKTGGEHNHKTKAFETRYRYDVDSSNNHLAIDGEIFCVLDPTSHPLGTVLTAMSYEDIIVTFLFADASGTVIDTQSVHLYPRDQIFYPVPLAVGFAYNPNYHAMALRISAFMYDGLTRMRSRQINAFDTLETGGVGDDGVAFDRCCSK